MELPKDRKTLGSLLSSAGTLLFILSLLRLEVLVIRIAVGLVGRYLFCVGVSVISEEPGKDS